MINDYTLLLYQSGVWSLFNLGSRCIHSLISDMNCCMLALFLHLCALSYKLGNKFLTLAVAVCCIIVMPGCACFMSSAASLAETVFMPNVLCTPLTSGSRQYTKQSEIRSRRRSELVVLAKIE